MPLKGPFVFALFAQRGPFDVSWLIAALVVDAVQRVLWRGLASNVSEKSGEVIAPFGADGNSPTAVEIPASVFWVKAPSFHVGPGAILGRVCASVRTSRRAALEMFTVKASAATSQAVLQAMGHRRFRATAITQTSPTRTAFFSFFRRAADYHETPKSLTCQILKYAHTGSL